VLKAAVKTIKRRNKQNDADFLFPWRFNDTSYVH
jgi:hypothetical protein